MCIYTYKAIILFEHMINKSLSIDIYLLIWIIFVETRDLFTAIYNQIWKYALHGTVIWVSIIQNCHAKCSTKWDAWAMKYIRGWRREMESDKTFCVFRQIRAGVLGWLQDSDRWGYISEKQVYRTGKSNYIPHIPWDVITCIVPAIGTCCRSHTWRQMSTVVIQRCC